MTQHAGQPPDFESFLTWEALTGILSYDPAKGEFRVAKPGKSGAVGVSQHHRKWVASASLNNERVYLGIFDALEDAGAARAAFNAKERHEFGPRSAETNDTDLSTVDQILANGEYVNKDA